MTILDTRIPADERRDKRLMLRLEQHLKGFDDGDPVADIPGLSDSVDDRVAALLVAGPNITLTYDDTAGTLTIEASGGGGSSSPVLGWAY